MYLPSSGSFSILHSPTTETQDIEATTRITYLYFFDPGQAYLREGRPCRTSETAISFKSLAANPIAGINHWPCILPPSQDPLRCSPAARQLHFSRLCC